MSTRGDTGGSWRRLLLRPWHGPLGLAAAGVIVVQAAWRGWFVFRGFFTQDDFVVLRLAREKDLSDLLFTDYYGHLLPARWVFAWVVAQGGPLPWELAATLMVALMVLTSAVMWVVLSRLLPGRWTGVPILALFCFSPLTLWTTQQWIVAMQFFPVTICLLLSALAIVRFIEDGWGPGRWFPAVLTALALLFQERALLFPVAYAGVALFSVGGSWAGRIPRALRQLWVTWCSLIAVVGGYFALHVAVAPINATPVVKQSGDLLSLIGNLVFRNAAPGLVGGPWRPSFFGEGALSPPSWAVLLSVALMAGLVVWTASSGGPRAWWAWLMFGLYLAADVAILFGGKSQFGSDIGLIPRYTADLVPVLALTVSASVRDVRWSAPARLERLRGPRFALILLAVVIGASVPTTLAVAPTLENRDDRAYATNLVRQLRVAPDTIVLDTAPPQGILVPWFGSYTRVSTVLATLRPKPRFDVPSEDMMVADPRGRLRPLRVTSVARSGPGPVADCGLPVTSKPVLVALERTVPAGRHVARIDYYTAQDSLMTVRLGDEGAESEQLVANTGLHSIFLPVEDQLSSLEVQTDDPAVTVCLAKVTVGRPAPAS